MKGRNKRNSKGDKGELYKKVRSNILIKHIVCHTAKLRKAKAKGERFDRTSLAKSVARRKEGRSKGKKPVRPSQEAPPYDVRIRKNSEGNHVRHTNQSHVRITGGEEVVRRPKENSVRSLEGNFVRARRNPYARRQAVRVPKEVVRYQQKQYVVT